MLLKRFSRILFLSIFSFALIFTSCKTEESDVAAGGVTFKITLTEDYNMSISKIMQDVNNKAIKGPITIEFGEGNYNITQGIFFSGVDGMHIKGAGRNLTTLNFDGVTDIGININSSKNVILCDFTAKEVKDNNIIEVKGCDGVRFSNVGAVWNNQDGDSGKYALYPVNSVNVIVENCYAANAIDAGIYSGQNRNVIIRNNVSEKNVFGFEVENSINTIVTNNRFNDNSSGGLIYDLDNLFIIRGGRNCLIENNIFENNNRNNISSGLPDSGFVANAPVGAGLLIASSDNVEVRNNKFLGNELLGVALTSYFLVDPTFASKVLLPENATYSAFNSAISLHDNEFKYGLYAQNLAGTSVTASGQLILASYATAGIDPATNPLDYLIENLDYSQLDTLTGLPAGATDQLIGERPYLGQTGQNVVEANYLTLNPMDGSGIVVTSKNLTDFAKPKKGVFRSFNAPIMPSCN